MKIKQHLKNGITKLLNLWFRVDIGKNVYFGLLTKFVGGGNIKLGDNVDIMPYAMLICRRNGIITFGENSMIGMYGMIGSMGKIVIGKDVLMGQNVFISDSNHAYENIHLPIRAQGDIFTPTDDGSPNIYIGDGSWIGRNSIIIGNVHIGKHCVIGANSVVNKDIPDYSVAVGAPAKIIKRYCFTENKWVKI